MLLNNQLKKMLSYQHGYHAGNFADVVKHLVLTRILSYMVNKEKPIFYLETHAGRGIYDLASSQANKTQEYRQGVSILWEHKNQLLPIFTPYLQAISQLNKQELRLYPGSPYLAMSLLREQDRIFCCELHPREFQALQQLPCQGKRVFFSQQDGLAAMNALLPPKERRGLIFIDPSFEVKTDYKQIPLAIKQAVARFGNGIFCLWYPLIESRLNEQLARGLRAIDCKALRIEFYLASSQQGSMRSCGLWIINPPFTLVDELNAALKQLTSLLNPGDASFIIENI